MQCNTTRRHTTRRVIAERTISQRIIAERILTSTNRPGTDRAGHVMFKLALHWQILIGMIAGTLLGVTLNLTAATRDVTLQNDLPPGIDSVRVLDSSAQTTLQVDRDGQTIDYAIDPLGKPSATTFRNEKEFAKTQPELAELYLSRGQSTAKWIGGWLKRIGDLFLRALKMVAVPLIVASLLTGILNLGGGAGVGRMFRRTLTYYACTSVLAIGTGLLMVNLIQPGVGGGDMGGGGDVQAARPLGEVLFEQLEAMVPSNLIGAFAEPNFLSIIAFTIVFGLFTLRTSRSTQTVVRRSGEAALEVMMAITTAIIKLAPLGVFFLIAAVTATQGLGLFIALGKYVVAVALALAVHAFVTLPIILWIFAKRSPIEYFKAMSPALLTAFSSASSNGTLPLTMENVEARGGVSNKTGSFVLPLGATINMDGTALYEVVAVLFIAQLHNGGNLEFSAQIIVALTALLASVGAAGIPHAGLVMMAIILQAVGLPAELQGIILAVDRVLDMARTAVNVWSDSCGCAVIDAMQDDAPEASVVPAS